MSWRRDKTLWGLTLGLAGLLLLNFVVPEWFRSILTLSLARGSVALGLLVLWRCGLISFGHALYFGFGAYTVGLMGRYLGITDAFLTIACGVATAGLLAFLLGFLLRQYRGIFFALLNMAFSMILYGVLAKLEELGSTDGISLEVTTYLWYAPLGAENKTGAVYLRGDPDLGGGGARAPLPPLHPGQHDHRGARERDTTGLSGVLGRAGRSTPSTSYPGSWAGSEAPSPPSPSATWTRTPWRTGRCPGTSSSSPS